jgi:hypothetical protein
MTEDRSGLLLTSMVTGRRGFNRLESINNGRVILFQEITGATLLTRDWTLDHITNHFYFTLFTKDDELYMEMEANGVPFLQAIQEIVAFTQIPKPAARSISVNHHSNNNNHRMHASSSSSSTLSATSTTMQSLMEFSANSGAIFTCASDIPLIIENFNVLTTKFTHLLDIGSRCNTILKLIPELKCNKEAALNFGERIEEIIRVLGDPDVGIIYNAQDHEKSLLNFHLSSFNHKLNDIIQYFYHQSRSGWLTINLSNRLQDSAKYKYNTFDADLISIINTLIKAMHLTGSLSLFSKKEYNMAVDVRKSIEALGGIQTIFEDMAKERALARLIQADGNEVHSEFAEFLNKINAQQQHGTNNNNNNNNNNNRSSFSSSILSGGNNAANPSRTFSSSSSSSFSLTGWRTSIDGRYSFTSFSSSTAPTVLASTTGGGSGLGGGGAGVGGDPSQTDSYISLPGPDDYYGSFSSYHTNQSTLSRHWFRRYVCCCSRSNNSNEDDNAAKKRANQHSVVAMKSSRVISKIHSSTTTSEDG